MLSADQLFPNPSIRSHIPSQASLLLPHRTSSLTLVNSLPRANHRSHVCRSQRRYSSSGLTHSRRRFPPCPNLLHTIHRAHPVHRKRSPHSMRVSHRLTADSNNNKVMNRTHLVRRRPVILIWICLVLCLRRNLRHSHPTSMSRNRSRMGSNIPRMWGWISRFSSNQHILPDGYSFPISITSLAVHGRCSGSSFASDCFIL